jgi:hypothetical protein
MFILSEIIMKPKEPFDFLTFWYIFLIVFELDKQKGLSNLPSLVYFNIFTLNKTLFWISYMRPY